MYSKDKIILIQINYFSIGCNSFLVDWIRIFAIPTQQLRNRYRTCILKRQNGCDSTLFAPAGNLNNSNHWNRSRKKRFEC